MPRFHRSVMGWTGETIMAVQETRQELEAILRKGDFAACREAVKNWPPRDLAALLDDATLEDEVVLFRILPRAVAAETFSYLAPHQQERLLKAMAREEVTAILDR